MLETLNANDNRISSIAVEIRYLSRLQVESSVLFTRVCLG